MIIVISDIHVSAGALDDCDLELENCLVGFLGELSSKDSAIKLVINGDFLDFIQAPPWQGAELEAISSDGNVNLCFTEDQSVEKLKAIIAAHPRVFEALGQFLGAKPENELVIIPGNHDADFFWPEVRKLFSDTVGSQQSRAAGRVEFHLEQVYNPPEHKEAWIEHGHQYDPINRFHVGDRIFWSKETPPIFTDEAGRQRLFECIGTRFLIRFMNQLDASYPFIDNVKPFSRLLRIFGASAVVGGFGPIKAAIAVWAMLRYLAVSITHNAGDLLGLEQEQGQQLSALLLNTIKKMDPLKRKAFSQRLVERGYALEGKPLTMHLEDAEQSKRVLEFLAENFDLTAELPTTDESYLSLGGTPGTLSLVRGFSVDETRELVLAAGRVQAQNDVRTIIMGHTHEQVVNPPGIKYINTGCWTRYYDFRRSIELTSWSILKSDSYKLFPYQLNYAEIRPENTEPTRLVTYLERKS
jgi:UDP-2,3-diacylglucosamine pyrophosphatase LpxH